VSGQSPVEPETGELIEGSLTQQVDRTLDNLFAILEAAGFTPDELVSVNVLLADIADRAEVNAVYARRFAAGRLPTRTMVEVAAVAPDGARLEIQAIAARSDWTIHFGAQAR
jgi:2-iminobutanoate/2-iminopropanoate deaminase